MSDDDSKFSKEKTPLRKQLSKKLSGISNASLRLKLSVKEISVESDSRFHGYLRYAIIPKQENPITSMHEYFKLCDKEMALIYPNQNCEPINSDITPHVYRKTSILDVRVPDEVKRFERKVTPPMKETTHAYKITFY